jgi:hypothetical protein
MITLTPKPFFFLPQNIHKLYRTTRTNLHNTPKKKKKKHTNLTKLAHSIYTCIIDCLYITI